MEPVPQLGPQHFASWGQGWGGSSCSRRPPPWGLGRGLSGVNPCCPRKSLTCPHPQRLPLVLVVSFLLAPPLPHAGPEQVWGSGLSPCLNSPRNLSSNALKSLSWKTVQGLSLQEL